MCESSELEEGEMATNEAFNDIDVDLSYIDKKVENVLGDLQKKFESLDCFGPKIHDYGTFLPTYYRHPPAVPSFQKTSLGNYDIQRFPNNLHGKNMVHQSVPTLPFKLVTKQEPQKFHTPVSLLTPAPEMVPIKKENANVTGNDISHHKPFKVRIKMGNEIVSRKVSVVCDPVPKGSNGPEIVSRKVAMVCKDLGLDNSPNSTPRNSREDDSQMLLNTSMVKQSESVSRILEEMTAITVPEDLLMSPLPDNLLVMKDKNNEPSIQTQKKFSDGRRRKAVDCFDATTVKKQKVFSNNEFTTKINLKKSNKKDGESCTRISLAKPNKMKNPEKEKMTYQPKLKQNSSKNCVGEKILSNKPLKDSTYIGQKSMAIGIDSAAAPSSTSLDQDEWVQCDSCETWRLLPFGMKPDPLLKMWICSMQTWLPQMNHCGVSEEETTNAIRNFHVTETGIKRFSDVDNSYHPLTSGSLPNPVEKKSVVNDLSKRVSSSILADTAKPMRSNSHVLKIKRKIPLETSTSAAQISNDFLQNKKIDQRSSGTGSQIKIKKEKDFDRQEIEGSKQIKSFNGRDIKEEIHFKQDEDWSLEEPDTKKRLLLSSKKKPINSPVKKIRVIGYKQVNNNETKSKLSADGEEKESSMEKTVKLQEMKAHQRNESFQDAGYREYRKTDGELPWTSLKTVFRNRAWMKNFNADTHEIVDRSSQAANDVLEEAKKLRKLAECIKSSDFDVEYKETNFKAALKFLLGASLLKIRSTERVEGGNMSPLEAYHTAARLSENCAQQYEASQEMGLAALAYKCMEVACMRVVYSKSLGLSGEWKELHKLVQLQMTPEGESPSSSASEIDCFCPQGVIDRSGKTLRGLSHVTGNLLPVARSQQTIVPLLDFSENMNLAMEASAKSLNALRAATVTLEENYVSAIKNVVDFSFHDVEALIQMIEPIMNVLSPSRLRG